MAESGEGAGTSRHHPFKFRVLVFTNQESHETDEFDAFFKASYRF